MALAKTAEEKKLKEEEERKRKEVEAKALAKSRAKTEAEKKRKAAAEKVKREELEKQRQEQIKKALAEQKRNEEQASKVREAAAAKRAQSQQKVRQNITNLSTKSKTVDNEQVEIIEDRIEEKNRIVTRVTVKKPNGSEDVYQFVKYNWGGAFYFKNNKSITKDVYDLEIAKYK